MEDERVVFVALTKDEIAKMNREAALIGAQAANQVHQKEEKERKDRRLHNTDLLLKNYRSFKAYCKKAVYEKPSETTEEVIEDIMSMKGDRVIVDSILRTTQRTEIIVEHIDKMLDVYRVCCSKGTDAEKRQYNVIKELYIKGTAKNAAEISQKMGVSKMTISTDLKTAKNRLSVLFFGIDGINYFRD